MANNIICLWYGAIGNIPTGWTLCDGNNGTPNLKNKFVIGAGNSFNPGDTGGSLTHPHPFTGDGHRHTLGWVPGLALNSNPGGDLTSEDSAVGDTDVEDHKPPYHALAYVMKT